MKNNDYPTPKEIVEYLDKYIIGQDEAKKSVAIALRNRAGGPVQTLDMALCRAQNRHRRSSLEHQAPKAAVKPGKIAFGGGIDGVVRIQPCEIADAGGGVLEGNLRLVLGAAGVEHEFLELAVSRYQRDGGRRLESDAPFSAKYRIAQVNAAAYAVAARKCFETLD